MPDPMQDLDDRRRYHNALRRLFEQRATALADDLLDEEITLDQWHESMKALIRESHIQQFIVGKGGIKDAILNADYGQLGTPIREQYQYLKGFADDIFAKSQAGESLGFIKNRATLYMRSSAASFWRGAIPVKLPQYPRDGKTECRTNCKCSLDVEYETNDDDEITKILVYWRLHPADHCDDCPRLSREWNPLEIEVE